MWSREPSRGLDWNKKIDRMFVRSIALLLLLVLHQLPASGHLQAEHRGAGTSFSLAAAKSGLAKQLQMQVCITIGCCHHVCRQFLGDSGQEAAQAPPELLAAAPVASLDEVGDGGEQLLEEAISESAALAPSILEWAPRELFSPSIKFLRLLNTGNTSWIRILSKPVCSDPRQFSVQEIESSAIAPGESLAIPVVFIPSKVAAASAKVIVHTSAGTVVSQLRGEARNSPYEFNLAQAQSGGDSSESKQRIVFHNPHDEIVEIEELQAWPGDSYNKVLCLPEEADGRLTSCFADGFPKAYLSNSRYEKYSHQEEFISLNPVESSWKIQPGQTVHLAELDMNLVQTKSLLIYMKFSSDKVLIFPLTRNESDETLQEESPQRIEAPKPENMKWMPTSDMVAIKIAEALLKDLSHTLLRQSHIRKGSLSGSRREQSLVSEDQVSYQKMVQTGIREKVWIDLVNPSSAPLLVNLILAPEVKSRNCRYRANWFWQGQNPQLHRENSVFTFESGALTEAAIPGNGKVSLGPLTFHPRHKCDWSSLLFIKNNSTGLEWVPVRGKSGSAKLQFVVDDSVQRALEMVVDHSEEEEENEDAEQICGRVVQKVVQVRNSGELPLHVHGLDLSEAPRIELVESQDRKSFSLEVGEKTDLSISYEPEFQGKVTNQVIKLATSVGVVKLSVVPRLSRRSVALCRNSSLEERLALPVSLCALVLVMGGFSWLLLQELSRSAKPGDSFSKEKIREFFTWKGVWSIVNSFTIVRSGALKKKPRLEESGVVTLKTFHQELPYESQRCKLRKKKKVRSNSSPRSSTGSCSTPGSPHSGSETEMQVPSIERILNSTRFSEARTAAPKRSKTRISVMSEEVAIDQARWNAKLDIQRSASFPDLKPDAPAIIHENKSAVTPVPPETRGSDEVSSTPAAAPAPSLLPETSSTEIHSEESLQAFELPSFNMFGTRATIGSEVNQREVRQQSEPLYDIWGDHLGDIFTAFSSPNSPNAFGGNNQSFFSQTPHSTRFGDRLSSSAGLQHQNPFPSSDSLFTARQGMDRFPSSGEDRFTVTPDGAQACSNLQSFDSLKLLSFLPQTDVYSGNPEPPLVGWNANSRNWLSVYE